MFGCSSDSHSSAGVRGVDDGVGYVRPLKVGKAIGLNSGLFRYELEDASCYIFDNTSGSAIDCRWK